ncbi:hypothetical protein EC991_004640 [Linnemannia zychae]|nr:hypothetical protein EC991_004640 [Linnemannia zychae]
MASRSYALRLTRTSRAVTGTTVGRDRSCHYVLVTDSATTTLLRQRVSSSRLYTSCSSGTTASSQRHLPPLLSTPSMLRYQQRAHGTFLTRIQPYACFSTYPVIRQLSDTLSSSSEPAATEDNARQAALNALVGLPCPGCGSPFQTIRPQEPGYLSSSKDTASDAEGKKEMKKGKGKKGPRAPAVAANATTMSPAQYEDYLETLDPKLLKEIMAGGAPVEDGEVAANSTSGLKDEEGDVARIESELGAGTTEARTGAGKTETEGEVSEPNILDRKATVLHKPTPTPQRLVCHRCHSLSHHASPLTNSSTLSSVIFPSPPAPIPKHLETLAQSKTSTVVLVVDLVDFPLSLPQPVIQELLKTKKTKRSTPGGGWEGKEYPTTPIILVGNKFDVMPKGTSKHTILNSIQTYFSTQGFDSNVRAIHLVSAKNPEGDEIRMLLKSIGTAWSKSGKGNVVMVGGENVGKSQLLNAFLKEGARWRPNMEQVERRKGAGERAERQKKLSRLLGGSPTTATNDNEEDEEDKEWAAMTGKDTFGAEMDKYESVYKSRGQEKLEKYQTTVSNIPGTTLERIKVPLSVLSRFMGATYKEVQTKWLMDTPGIRPAAGQLTSWLTLEELKVTIPKRVLKPVSFTLEEGKSFFLGGLVRIDCLSIGKPSLSPTSTQDPTTQNQEDAPLHRPRGSNPIPKLTIFSTLPLHKTSTFNADKFLEKTAHGELTILQPPFGSPERLAAFPGLKPVSSKDVVIVNRAPAPSSLAPYASSASLPSDPFARLDDSSRSAPLSPYDSLTRREREIALLQYNGQHGVCDLVFSGIGWVMISGKFHGENQAVRLKVWTPQGQGAMVREPALLGEWGSQHVEKTKGGVRQSRKTYL